jgi:hypothetical protein
VSTYVELEAGGIYAPTPIVSIVTMTGTQTEETHQMKVRLSVQ